MNNLGENLRNIRKNKGMSVGDLSSILISKGYKKASVKTIYSWESCNSQPTPDVFLTICSILEVKDVLSAFGYKNEEAPAEPQELNKEEGELIRLYRQCSKDDRMCALQVVRNFAALEKQRLHQEALPESNGDAVLDSILKQVQRKDSQEESLDASKRQ